MSLPVSVVVPTYQRPEYLQRCLQALLEQDFDPSAYEILIVDDANEAAIRTMVEGVAERTEAIAVVTSSPAHLTSHSQVSGAFEPAGQAPSGGLVRIPRLPRIRYVPGTRRGPATARNLGWQAAEGEVIAFTDDDCLPDPNWLKNGMRAMTPGVMGASGQVIVPLPPDPTDYERDASGLRLSQFVTANCFYRREALEAMNGFDEAFQMAWREDSDLYFRMLRSRYPLVLAPEALVVHPLRPAPWGISLKQQRKSMFNALLYKKHPRLYREKLQAAPPWGYYLALFSLLMILAGSAAGWMPLVYAGMGAWLGFTLQFTLRRLEGTSHRPEHVLEMLVTSTLIPLLSIYWRLRGAVRFKVFFL